MGTLLISKVREEYPDRMMVTFSVVPSPKVRASSHPEAEESCTSRSLPAALNCSPAAAVPWRMSSHKSMSARTEIPHRHHEQLEQILRDPVVP